MGSEKWLTGAERTIVRLRGFPYVIFSDAKALFVDELVAMKAANILSNYDLESVLELLIKKKKLEHCYTEMNLCF